MFLTKAFYGGFTVSGLYPFSSAKKEYNVSEIGFISAFK
jgi:hypothetical protein